MTLDAKTREVFEKFARDKSVDYDLRTAIECALFDNSDIKHELNTFIKKWLKVLFDGYQTTVTLRASSGYHTSHDDAPDILEITVPHDTSVRKAKEWILFCMVYAHINCFDMDDACEGTMGNIALKEVTTLMLDLAERKITI